jgi:hypothetical protein
MDFNFLELSGNEPTSRCRLNRSGREATTGRRIRSLSLRKRFDQNRPRAAKRKLSASSQSAQDALPYEAATRLSSKAPGRFQVPK